MCVCVHSRMSLKGPSLWRASSQLSQQGGCTGARGGPAAAVGTAGGKGGLEPLPSPPNHPMAGGRNVTEAGEHCCIAGKGGGWVALISRWKGREDV